jgi:hypothetical protein
MTTRQLIFIKATAIVLLARGDLAAQALNPPYLREMPSVERVLSDQQAADPAETAARQMGALTQLKKMIEDAGVGVQAMQTDLLKSLFNDGEKGPPTPPGIRMHGIFAAPTGFSFQFFPESVILGCGPDTARAYPYAVSADGTKANIKVDAPDHPLTLAFASNGSLDPGLGTYQVHGRIVVGQNADGDFTFAPLEQTCSLGLLAPDTVPRRRTDLVPSISIPNFLPSVPLASGRPSLIYARCGFMSITSRKLTGCVIPGVITRWRFSNRDERSAHTIT